jgi:hypothetical protein
MIVIADATPLNDLILIDQASSFRDCSIAF